MTEELEGLLRWLEEEIAGDRPYDAILHSTRHRIANMLQVQQLEKLVAEPQITQFQDPNAIIACVVNFYGTTARAILGASRKKGCVAPRHVAMYLIRQLCPHETLGSIGKRFSGRDHATVLHAVNKIRDDVWRDKGCAAAVRECYSILTQQTLEVA